MKTTTTIDRNGTKETLIAQAEKAHQAWKQYDGMWRQPEWRLVTMRSDVRTKVGLAFTRGEYAIARERTTQELEQAPELAGTVIAYSVRNRINTAVRIARIEWIEGEACSACMAELPIGAHGRCKRCSESEGLTRGEYICDDPGCAQAWARGQHTHVRAGRL